ncbi:MAG: hypothetical protein ACREFE_18480, partial [Limisphaerales bacterium]
MKKLFLILFRAGMFAAVTAQAATQPDLIARVHFLGGDKISADANSAAFTNEFSSPEARALESQTLDKLSRAPYAWFKSKITAGAGDGSAQLRPLLGDLLKSEWVFEMRDAMNGSPEYALAIRLSDARAKLWRENLAALLEAWTKLPARKIQNGWELKKHLPPNLIRSTYNDGWLIVDCGQNELPLENKILRPFLNSNRHANATNWLTADLNWPRLAQLFPALAKLNFPKTEMQVVGRDGNFRLNGKFTLAQPLPMTLENWRMPTNTIHEPFISFTAMRGIAPWLKKQSWARRFEIQPLPDQIFIWALPQIPFQTFFAAPVSNATNALAQLAGKLSVNTNWENHFIMPLTLAVTAGQISWVGLPFIAPDVAAVREKSGDFLVAGFFPNTPEGKPLPPELFAQLKTPNLVYYHWEITAER